jgi:periplasmic divalent cation tolerance protein
MSAMFVYVTAPSPEEAARIGRAVVEERLAACANVLDGMHSIYRWRGRLEEAKEVVLILKTRAERLPELTARVKALHSYEVPCVVALPIAGGNAAYLDWISAEAS